MFKYFIFTIVMIVNCIFLNVPYAEAQKNYSNIPGIVVKVYDGDTITLQNNNGTYKIRLAGIDAPESRQAYGNVSRNYLYNMVRDRFVYAEVQNKDRYGRYVAKIMLDNTDVNAEMLRAGLAWHYKQYNNNYEYAMLEQEAKKNRRGLWIEKNPIPPWIYRRNKK